MDFQQIIEWKYSFSFLLMTFILQICVLRMFMLIGYKYILFQSIYSIFLSKKKFSFYPKTSRPKYTCFPMICSLFLIIYPFFVTRNTFFFFFRLFVIWIIFFKYSFRFEDICEPAGFPTKIIEVQSADSG